MNPLKNALTPSFFIGILLLTGCSGDASDTDSTNETALAEAEYFADYDSPERKWGFLDKEGDVSISPNYDLVSNFTEGLAAVNYKGRWGYIDKDGDVVIPYRYVAAWPFINGYARVSTFGGKQCVIDRQGTEQCVEFAQELGDVFYGRVRVVTDGGEGFADVTGKMVIDPIYQRVDNFEYGLAVVDLDGKEGVIDTSGKYVIRPEFEAVRITSDHIALVKDADGFGFKDIRGKGRFSCDEKYVSARAVQGEVAAVKNDSGWHLLDASCQRLTERHFQVILPAGNGRWIAKAASGFGLLDQNGLPITAFNYQQINKFHEGIAVYRKDDLCGFMDNTGEEVTPPQYGLAWDFSEGLARAAFRDGIAFVEATGEVPFIPSYYELRDYSEGLAPFQEN